MRTTSHQPRRQRKALFVASSFERRRRMAVALSRELRTRYGRRSLPIRKGDTVRIISGSYEGREERVAKVNRRSYSVTLDNVTGKTADQKLKPLPLKMSHLILTRLNLSDAWRRRVLKVPESEAPREEAESEEGPSLPAAKAEKAPDEEEEGAEEELDLLEGDKEGES